MSNKRIALYDYVEIDQISFASGFVRSVSFSSEDEQVDASGFSATGVDEFLAGRRTRSVTVEFFMTRASNEVHQTLYPLHRDRTVFDFAWRHDMTADASATNPELRGSVQCLTYSPGATRGEAETFSVTLTAADSDGLTFHST